MLDRRELLLGTAALGLTSAVNSANAAPATDNPIVDAFVAENPFHGVVLLATDGKPTYARAIGMADIEAARPMTVGTTFRIASVSKFLTSIAVLRLAEQGRLELDAPIRKYLPDFRPDSGDRVTLRNLLSNGSGIPNLFSPDARLDPALQTVQMDTAYALRRYCQGALAFEPGTRFDYAVTNWFIVLAIVEAVTRQPFQQALRRIVLAPLGLGSTTAAGGIHAAPGTARSYDSVTPLVRAPNLAARISAAAGGYFSTAHDLLRMAHLVWDTGFLRPASRLQLRTVEIPFSAYALGGRVHQLSIGGTIYDAGWQTGRSGGFRTVVGHRFDTRETVVILNNTGLSQQVLDRFADRLFGEIAPA